MKPRTKNRSRESERLKRKQLLPLKYRYSERRKRVYVAAAIKIPAASNRTRHLWPPSCLLLPARACEKTWVQEKPSTNQTKVSFVGHMTSNNKTVSRQKSLSNLVPRVYSAFKMAGRRRPWHTPLYPPRNTLRIVEMSPRIVKMSEDLA